MRYLAVKTSMLALMIPAFGSSAWAQTSNLNPAPEQAAASPALSVGLADITVTARRRSENLQNVPDSISAFTSQTIVNSNIKSIGDLARITPGLNFRDGSAFAANFFDLRLRGIGTAQQGWPSVSLIVDGVPNDSPDVLTAGSLNDVERIEVLRGPQSALYGAGAIAGAINVITKRPTNDFHAEGRLYYGNGQDAQAAAAVSGAIVPDVLLGRLSVNYRDDNGRIDSATNGIHLDPHHRKAIEGRLIFDPTSNFEIDLHGNYDQERGGFAFQSRTNPPATGVNFTEDPEYFARDFPGGQSRLFERLAARINWDLGFASITSISSYSRTRQHGLASACYDDPSNPNPAWTQANGSILCVSNVAAFGNRAQTGQVQEVFQNGTDNYNTFFQDLRASSSSDSPIQWVLGASYMHRRAGNIFGTSDTIANNPASNVISNRLDRKLDKWWGVYGELGKKIGKFELTVDARYDDQRYYDTGYNIATAMPVVIPVSTPTGGLENTQEVTAHSFQPKGQVSYHITPAIMAYATVSRGFRAGFFNTGKFAVPEHTTNYEGGFKTAWFDHSLIVNVAGFHIDYSDQQTSTTTNAPPYRIPVTIPETRINGGELEASYRLTRTFTLSGDLAYLHAEVTDGTMSPKAPKWSGSVSGQWTKPLTEHWTLNAHGDVSFHSAEYLFIGNTQRVPANAFVNARIGLERSIWGIYFVGTNLTNAHEDQMQAGTTTPYRAVYPIEPRTYGIEVRVTY
jgi:iron complex outermembrane receptor protein